MGRIEDALNRAKEMHFQSRKNASSGNNRLAKDAIAKIGSLGRQNEVLQNVFSELQKTATFQALDEETLKSNRVTTGEQAVSIRSSYKMLRTRILQRLRANHWRKLAISSARSDAGKTLTAINTSISIANDPNQKVILIDLDLRRPSIAKYLGIEHRYGISDHLLNGVPIEDIVIRTEIDRLLVIPNFEPQDNSSELLSSPAMVSLVERLSNDADGSVLIFDLPPMLDADDMLAFSPQFDALLFVVAECETRRADLQQASNLIEELEVLGVVLNKSDDESPAYY